jgi:hypothetical protein
MSQPYDPRQQRPSTPPQWGAQPDPWAASAPGGAYGQPQYQPRPQQPQPGWQQHISQSPYPPQVRTGQPPQAAPPRRRGYGRRVALGAVVLAVVAGGAFYVSHGRAPAAALTCAQQYQAWKTGPANAPGKQLQADAATLSKAGEDIPVMTRGLQAVGADATALEAYPMPQCADPAGYWQQYLAAMKAAGDNAGSASGLGGIILAEAPLKQVPAIQSKLSAELAKTAGVKAS